MTARRRHSHANRGAYLEKMIERSWQLYARNGVGCGQKIATPTIQRGNGDFVRTRSTVDYIGVVGGVATAFDAKECRTTARLDLARLPYHQVRFLEDFHLAGGVAFVLVDFPTEDCFYAAMHAAIQDMAKGRRSAPVKAFREWSEPGLDRGVVRVPRGQAVPVHFAPAVMALREMGRN